MATEINDLASYQQFAMQQAQANNEWSAKQAQENRDWQKMMSDTAHQREVADLKAAGLNPVLSANSGAAVTSGATGDTDTSAAANVGQILQQVLSAQSAREVAGMYNAATIAAASIAANASMYNADQNAKTQREYPNSMAGIISRVLHNGQESASGNSVFQSTANRVFKNLGIPLYSRNLLGFSKFLKNYNVKGLTIANKNYWTLYDAWKSGGYQKFVMVWNQLGLRK